MAPRNTKWMYRTQSSRSSVKLFRTRMNHVEYNLVSLVTINVSSLSFGLWICQNHKLKDVTEGLRNLWRVFSRLFFFVCVVFEVRIGENISNSQMKQQQWWDCFHAAIVVFLLFGSLRWRTGIVVNRRFAVFVFVSKKYFLRASCCLHGPQLLTALETYHPTHEQVLMSPHGLWERDLL